MTTYEYLVKVGRIKRPTTPNKTTAQEAVMQAPESASNPAPGGAAKSEKVVRFAGILLDGGEHDSGSEFLADAKEAGPSHACTTIHKQHMSTPEYRGFVTSPVISGK